MKDVFYNILTFKIINMGYSMIKYWGTVLYYYDIFVPIHLTVLTLSWNDQTFYWQ